MKFKKPTNPIPFVVAFACGMYGWRGFLVVLVGCAVAAFVDVMREEMAS